jgi:hypothetical protein
MGVDSGSTTVEVGVDFDIDRGKPFCLQAFLVGRSVDIERASSEEFEFLCETDRLRYDESLIERAPSPHEMESASHASYERTNAEGCYLLWFSGNTGYQDWTAGFVARKSGYERAKQVYHDRDYAQYATDALQSGNAGALGSILVDTAQKHGITGSREQVDFLIDFVQSLPYVPDTVSAGLNEYPKYVVETLVEAGGDCEDSAILLSSLLQSEPFGYGAVLLLLPNHMAVGVKGGDLPGSYYEYRGMKFYYVETTGEGWSVGEIPPDYQNDDATILTI